MEFTDPEHVLQRGFEVHGYFNLNQLEEAASFYNNYISYLSSKEIQPTFTSFSESADGPQIGPNFAIHLMGTLPKEDVQQQDGATDAIFCFGHAQVFAKFNGPQGIRIRIHPNSRKNSQNVDNLNHTERAMWVTDDAPPPCLSVEFFEDLLRAQEKSK